MIALAIACAVLAVAVMVAMFWPLLRGVNAITETGQFDLAVYRDQLKELERDIARGVLAPQEAAAARVEIQRRMLAPQRSQQPGARATAAPGLAALLTILVIAGSGGVYLWLGAPTIPDQPAATRTPAPQADQKAPHNKIETAAAALKAKLKDDPENAERWLLYARTVSELARWPDAIDAYQHVMKLEPDQPEIISAYGEMLVMSADGMVTPDARSAFTQTVKLDPAEQVARFYLALSDLQAGEPKLAIDAWMKLAADAEDGSELRTEIIRRIADTAKQAGIPAPTPPPAAPRKAAAAATTGGPDAAAMAAAANMTPEQRQAMVGSMVAQLAAKLETNPNDADGWLKLGRAYLVINEPDKSTDAYDRATKLKPNDASIAMQEIQALLESRTPEAPVPQRAIALLRRVETLDPKNPEALWLLGVASAQSNRPDDSQRYWQRLLDLLPPTDPDRKAVQDALDTLK